MLQKAAIARLISPALNINTKVMDRMMFMPAMINRCR